MALQLEQQAQEVLNTLNAQAEARNMRLAEYLQLFAEAGQIAAPGVAPTIEEFESLLEQISEGLALFPPLPSDFSRQDIYAGHN
ncbi:MAG: hypothetical protein HY040_26355 [Planctomycetes bacterium]|nr:hypothetical protein [Planctomycetota bacterium]